MEELLSDGATVSTWVNNNSKLSCDGKEKLCIVVSLLLCTFSFQLFVDVCWQLVCVHRCEQLWCPYLQLCKDKMSMR